MGFINHLITGGPTLYLPIYKVAPTPDTSGGNGPNIDVTSLIIPLSGNFKHGSGKPIIYK